VPDILVQRVTQKKFGRKSGEGFYVWRDGKPLRTAAQDADIPPDLTDRLILPMLNEAAATLREGVIEDADLLDAGAIFATGFAPFRGGPLKYAKTRGIDAVVSSLTELEQRFGERFHPDAGWGTLIAPERPAL
jgi:3-hydroxyacyl-CoA dehydrogenase/enoyl-CoA hydratase/3-hydroxybutyryl-CoA epimerase